MRARCIHIYSYMCYSHWDFSADIRVTGSRRAGGSAGADGTGQCSRAHKGEQRFIRARVSRGNRARGQGTRQTAARSPPPPPNTHKLGRII